MPNIAIASFSGPSTGWKIMRAISATQTGARNIGSRKATRYRDAPGTLWCNATANAKPRTYCSATERKTMIEVVAIDCQNLLEVATSI